MMNLIRPSKGYSPRNLSKIFLPVLFLGCAFSPSSSAWEAKLRVKTLKGFERILHWTFGEKFKYSIESQKTRIDIKIPELKAFADTHGYFSDELPMVGKVTNDAEAFATICGLLEMLCGEDSEYLQIAVAEVVTKVLGYHDLQLGQTVSIPTRSGGNFPLERFVVDKVFDLWHGMPAFGLIPEREGVDSILLFRGTDASFATSRGWASVLSDLDMSGPGFCVFQRSRIEIGAWLKAVHDKGKPARVMGFSLGGALAAYTFIYENRWLAREGSLSIGSPGMKDKPLAEWRQLSEKGGFVSFIAKGDFAPKVGKLFGTAYLLSTPETYRPLTAHTLLMSAQPYFLKSKIDT
jgi:hypothetical protein